MEIIRPTRRNLTCVRSFDRNDNMKCRHPKVNLSLVELQGILKLEFDPPVKEYPPVKECPPYKGRTPKQILEFLGRCQFPHVFSSLVWYGHMTGNPSIRWTPDGTALILPKLCKDEQDAKLRILVDAFFSPDKRFDLLRRSLCAWGWDFESAR
jgi:hypothetical protein